ncbi:MAG: LSM domain-containing protein [Candidatus Methanofastidiosia archaeon]
MEVVFLSEKPFDLIHQNLDKLTSVYLRDGRILKGTMIGYDKDLNIALSDATEEFEDMHRKLGKVIIRRNNILSIESDKGILWQG